MGELGSAATAAADGHTIPSGLICPSCGTAVAPQRPSTPVPAAAVPPDIMAAISHAHALSPRERSAFFLLGLGYDNRSIARRLAISERTAKRHVTAILRKLRLESRLQAGLAALLTLSQVQSPGDGWPGSVIDAHSSRRETGHKQELSIL